MDQTRDRILNGYEFSAPKWFDFANVEAAEQDGTKADSWFDTAAVNALKSPLEHVDVDGGNAQCAKENSQPNTKPIVPPLNLGVLKQVNPAAKPPKPQSAPPRKALSANAATGAPRAKPTLFDDTCSSRNRAAALAPLPQPPHNPPPASARSTGAPPVSARSAGPTSARSAPSSPSGLATARRAHSSHRKTKTSEELELELVEFQAAEARRLMQLNSQRWQQALLPAVQPGKCSTTSLTEPAAFSLATDDRLRGHAHVEVRPWRSMAQEAASVLNRDRRLSWIPDPGAHPPTKTTHAHSPQFATSARSRPPKVKSTAELEEEALAHAGTFKAKPINHGVPPPARSVGHVERPMPTRPQPFKLSTETRVRAAHPPPEQEPPPPAKRMRVAPPPSTTTSNHEGYMPLRPTRPVSPKLATMQRAKPPPAPAEEPAPVRFRAQPIPVFDQRPIRAPKRRASAPAPLVPFRLATEQRGNMHQAQLAQQLAQEEAQRKAAAMLKARPIHTTIREPHVPSLPLPAPPRTVPQPFVLRSVELHEAEEWRRAQDALREEEQRRKMTEFKARPIVQHDPFVPKPSDKPLTVAQHVTLRSDSRAAKRQEWEVKMAAQAEAEAVVRAREAQAQAARQAEELRAYRKSLEYKARPMPGRK